LPTIADVKLIELAHASRIDANNLAVNDGVLDAQLGERLVQRPGPCKFRAGDSAFLSFL